MNDKNNKNSISIIVTHNARLRCLITKLFNNSSIVDNEEMRNKFKDYRWQNCCILKLTLVPNPNPNESFKLL